MLLIDYFQLAPALAGEKGSNVKLALAKRNLILGKANDIIPNFIPPAKAGGISKLKAIQKQINLHQPFFNPFKKGGFFLLILSKSNSYDKGYQLIRHK